MTVHVNAADGRPWPLPRGDRTAEYARGQAKRDAKFVQMAAAVRAADGPEERWVTIADGFYDVSVKGRVRRMKPSYGSHIGRILTPTTIAGYQYVTVAVRGDQRRVSVHGLVAEAFIGPRPPGFDVNHIDGDKANNRAENLEYVTHAGNMQHALANGLLSPKLDAETVGAIRAAVAAGEGQREAAARFGISLPQLNKIVRGVSWRHVP